jgi:hypothetical protein
MIRLLLIIVMLTQMGCSVVHTTVGTFLGTLSADVVKDELDKDEDEDKKVKP